MKLLLTNSIGKTKWGGGEKWMILAAQGLREKGHQVTIGCYPYSVLDIKASEKGIPTTPIMIRSDISIRGASQLYKFINTARPDVIIGLQNRDIMYAGLASALGHKPVIIARHGVRLMKKNLKHRIIYNISCKGLITNTKTIKSIYDGYGWWDDSFVKVIYNGVEQDDIFHARLNLAEYIPGFNPNHKIIVSMGRLSSQKGFQYLIRAAAEATKGFPDTYFLIAGKGKEKHRLQSEIKKYQLEKNFFILPFQNNVKPLLKMADLFVLPSLYEGMPNVIMEALSINVPVICTKVNGAAELFGEKDTEHLIPPANVVKLKEAILKFLQTGKVEYNTERVKERVTREFSLETMIENLESYLTEKLKRS